MKMILVFLCGMIAAFFLNRAISQSGNTAEPGTVTIEYVETERPDLPTVFTPPSHIIIHDTVETTRYIEIPVDTMLGLHQIGICPVDATTGIPLVNRTKDAFELSVFNPIDRIWSEYRYFIPKERRYWLWADLMYDNQQHILAGPHAELKLFGFRLNAFARLRLKAEDAVTFEAAIGISFPLL